MRFLWHPSPCTDRVLRTQQAGMHHEVLPKEGKEQLYQIWSQNPEPQSQGQPGLRCQKNWIDLSQNDKMLCCRGLEWNWAKGTALKEPTNQPLDSKAEVKNKATPGLKKSRVESLTFLLGKINLWLEGYPGLDTDFPNDESCLQHWFFKV